MKYTTRERESSEKWLGPGKIIFQDGKVVFIRHGAVYIRASVNKIIRRGAEFNNSENNSESVVREKEIQQRHEIIEETLDEEIQSTPEQHINEQSESNILKLKKNDQIQIKDNISGDWQNARIVNRAVKLSSQRLDKNWFNVETDQKTFSVNLDAVSFKIIESEVNEVLFTEIIPRSDYNNKECLEAKKAELEKLQF